MLEIKPLCEQLCLGRQGENLARIIYFKEPELWKEKFGEGVCELLHKRNGDEAPYPVVLDVENGKYGWKITDVDTSVAGQGECELYYSVNGVVVKSKIWPTIVQASLGGDIAEVPDPYKPWVDEVLEAAEKVESATTHQPTISDNNTWLVWDAETMTYVDTGVSASGGGSPEWSDIPNKPNVEKGVYDGQVLIGEGLFSPHQITKVVIGKNNDHTSQAEIVFGVGYDSSTPTTALKIGRQNIDPYLNYGNDGFIDMCFSKVINIPTPTNDNDAVPKSYLDNIVGDIETALDNVITLQENLIGGDTE